MPGTLMANDRSPSVSASRTAVAISSATRSCASAVDAARWGVRITRSSPRNGDSAADGRPAQSAHAGPGVQVLGQAPPAPPAPLPQADHGGGAELPPHPHTPPYPPL